MLPMPSSKGFIPLPPQNALPPRKCYSIEEEDAVISLQTSSADRFLPRAARRRNPCRVLEAFACDDFRMYEYKVRRCMRGRNHDWTDCPFAHPGEKARRRDPRNIHYSSSPCPDFRKGSCQRGDTCDHAHGVFECWLHPARYRTQACKDGKGCTRRVCFFAHSTQELRHAVVPVEESLTERASMVDSHTHDSGSPLCRVLLEDSFRGRVSMAHECEFGLPLQTDSSEDWLTAVVNSPNNSFCAEDSAVGLLPQDVYSNVGSISETLSMLTLSSWSSPLEAVCTLGFSSNNPMGVPLDMVSMVYSPSPNFPSGPGPSNATSVMGATSQDDSFTFEWSSAPAVFSPPSNFQYTPFVGGLSSSECHTTSEHSSYVGGSPSQQVHIQNRHCVKEAEFKDTFTDQQSLHSRHCNRLLGHGEVNAVLPPYLESPLFSQCTSGQNKWSPPSNNWNSEGTYNCDVLKLKFDMQEQLKFDMQHKICGRFGGESPVENAMPDLGWVHELVM